MLSRKPRIETGKNIYRTPSQISLLRACGRLLRVSTTLQIPTHLMKPCHTTVAPSRTQKLKLTSLRQGQQTSNDKRRSTTQSSSQKKSRKSNRRRSKLLPHQNGRAPVSYSEDKTQRSCRPRQHSIIIL